MRLDFVGGGPFDGRSFELEVHSELLDPMYGTQAGPQREAGLPSHVRRHHYRVQDGWAIYVRELRSARVKPEYSRLYPGLHPQGCYEVSPRGRDDIGGPWLLVTGKERHVTEAHFDVYEPETS